jgi:hypothetical protein
MKALWIWRGVRPIIGTALIGASILKAIELATEPTLDNRWFSSRAFWTTIVELQFVLGMLLVLDLLRKVTLLVTTLLFSVFVVYTLSMGLLDEQCGCLGRLEIDPWYVCAFDCLALSTLLWLFPQAWSVPPVSRVRFVRWTLFCGGAIFLAIPAGLAMATFSPTLLRHDGSFTGNRSVILLEPEKWPNHPFSLAQHIDIGGDLLKQHWIVLLYTPQCETCMAMIRQYQHVRTSREAPGSPRIALVAVNRNLSDVDAGLFSEENERLRTASLSPSKRWVCKTPVVVHVSHGIVHMVEIGD